MNSRTRGTLFAFLSAACFGTEAIFVKYAYADGVGTLTISVLRFAIAALALSPWFLSHVLRRGLRPRAWAALGIIGVFINTPVTLLLIAALERVSASVAIICLYIYPTIATVLAVPALGEKLSGNKVLALAGSFAGVALVVGAPGSVPDMLGVGFALLAAVVNAVSVIAVKRELSPLPPLAATGGVLTVSAFTVAIAAMLTRTQIAIPATAVPSVIGLGVVGTAMALGFLYAGLNLTEASRVSIITTLEPIFTVGLAVALLGERLTLLQSVGGLLIVGGVLVQQRSPSRGRSPTQNGSTSSHPVG